MPMGSYGFLWVPTGEQFLITMMVMTVMMMLMRVTMIMLWVLMMMVVGTMVAMTVLVLMVVMMRSC